MVNLSLISFLIFFKSESLLHHQYLCNIMHRCIGLCIGFIRNKKNQIQKMFFMLTIEKLRYMWYAFVVVSCDRLFLRSYQKFSKFLFLNYQKTLDQQFIIVWDMVQIFFLVVLWYESLENLKITVGPDSSKYYGPPLLDF